MDKDLDRGAGRGDPANEGDLKFVFDSTPLIHLVKVGLAWMIERLEGEKCMPPSVYAKVVGAGREGGFDDAFVTEELTREGVLRIEEPSEETVKLIAAHQDIHPGEAEAISLAKDLDAIAVVDDPVARSVAGIHGVRKEGSYMVILRTIRAGEIDKEEAKAPLRKLVASGWRCDVELYENILREIEEL